MSQDGQRGRHRARCSGAENVKAVTRRGLSHRGSRPGPRSQGTAPPEHASANGFANETSRDGETTRETADAHRGLRRVSETRRNAGDGGDARRMAHNPSSRVQIPPRYQGRRPFLERRKGLLHVVRELICARHGQDS